VAVALVLLLLLYPSAITFARDFQVLYDLRVDGNVNTPYGGIGRYENLLKYSEAFDDATSAANWAETNLTPTAGSANGPDGSTTTADTLTSTVADGYTEQSYDTGSDLTDRTFTFSVWLKTSAGTATSRLKILSANTTPGNGTVSVTTTWQRFSLSDTFSTDTADIVKAQIIPVDGGTGAVIAWGAQLEENSAAGVYVQTVASTVTASRGIVTNADLRMLNLNVAEGGTLTFGGDANIYRSEADTLKTDDALTVTGNLTVDGATTLGDGADNLTVNTTQLFVEGSSGNVGIGTTAPGATLDLGGNLKLGSDRVIEWGGGGYDLTMRAASGLNHTNIFIDGPDTNGVTINLRTNSSTNLGLFSGWTGYYDNQGSIYAPNGNLMLNFDAAQDVTAFQYATEGEVRELRIYGYRTGDASRQLQIGVGEDAADTASFDGVGNYYFDGNVGIGTTVPSANLDVAKASTATAAANEYASEVVFADTGVVTTGTDNVYGLNLDIDRTGATGGTINAYGLYADVTGDNAGAGTSTAYGIYAAATGGDTNYAGYFAGDVEVTGTLNAGTAINVDGAAIDLDDIADGSSYERVAAAELSSGVYISASETDSGIIELATTAEAQTGTDTARAVTPDGLTAGVMEQSWSQTDGLYIGTDEVRARDGDGLKLYDDGSAGIFVEDGGQVGIGTTAPASKLHLSGNGSANGISFDDDGSENLYTTGAVLATDDWFQVGGKLTLGAVGGADNVTLYKNAANVLRTDDSMVIDGDVGIGTTTPSADLDIAKTSTATVAASEYASEVVFADTGVVTTGTDNVYGLNLDIDRTGATGGTINAYGLYADVTGDNAGAGTSTAYGIYAAATGGDTNYAGYFSGDVEVTGTLTAGTITGLSGYLTADGTTDLTGDWTVATNNVTLTAGTLQAEHLYSTDDADITDNLTAGDIIIDEAGGVLAFSGNSSASILTTNAAMNTLTLGGSGQTNNESLTLDFETTADKVLVGTGSSVSSVDFGTIDLETDALDVSDGSITNVTDISLDTISADATNGTVLVELDSAAGADFRVATDALVVEGDSGYVGIGTTQPEAKLDVSGTLQVGTAGDTGVAHDLIMTNITSSTIKSYAGLTIQSGESNDNLNLTLKGTGTGNVYVDDNLQINGGMVIQDVVTIAADDTTPDVSGGNIFVTSANTGATAITDLDNPQVGQIIHIIGGSDTSSSTIADSGNFNLSAAWTASLDDVLILFVQADNDYVEIGRVNN